MSENYKEALSKGSVFIEIARQARAEALEEAAKIVRENDPDMVDVEQMILDLAKK